MSLVHAGLTHLGTLSAVAGGALLLALVFLHQADHSPLFTGVLAVALVARVGHECLRPRRQA